VLPPTPPVPTRTYPTTPAMNSSVVRPFLSQAPGGTGGPSTLWVDRTGTGRRGPGSDSRQARPNRSSLPDPLPQSRGWFGLFPLTQAPHARVVDGGRTHRGGTTRVSAPPSDRTRAREAGPSGINARHRRGRRHRGSFSGRLVSGRRPGSRPGSAQRRLRTGRGGCVRLGCPDGRPSRRNSGDGGSGAGRGPGSW
jgi:hypothetical protein